MMNRLFVRLLLFLFATGAVIQVSAQDDPSMAIGLTPYGTIHGGDVDSVNLSNGNLNVNIPFVSYPQRGNRLRMSFALIYNAKGLQVVQHCVGPPLPHACWYQWYHADDHAPISSMSVRPVDDQSALALKNVVMTSPGIYHNYYKVRTADGSLHPLGDTTAGEESLDATGFFEDSAGTYTIDRSGIRHVGMANFVSEASREDPNGNTINFNGSTYTDTLGRTIPAPPPPPSSGGDPTGCTGPRPIQSTVTWALPGYSVKICYVSVTIQTPPVSQPKNPYSDGSATFTQTLIQSIVLPNQTNWTFEYDDRDPGDASTINYGNLTKITFPTGATISYSWTTLGGLVASGYGNKSRYVVSRSVDAKDGNGPRTWTYDRTSFAGGPIVRDPLGNETAHTMTSLGGGAFYETLVQIYSGNHSTGQLLKSIQTDYTWSQNPLVPYNGQWTINVVPIRVTTTLDDGTISKAETDYDSGFTFTEPQSKHSYNATYGSAVANRDYDYGGQLLRQTSTQYMALSGPNASAYLANNLLSLPYTVQIRNGSAAQMSFTQYGYDESSLSSSGVGSTEQHDTAPPTGRYRGNQTSVSRWLNVGTLTCQNGQTAGTNSNVTSRAVYFDTGTTQTSADPCGNTNTYAYSNSYWGAFPTTVTNALGQQTINTYDFTSGLITSTSDPNHLTTSYAYDSMWRTSQVIHQNGGVDTMTYQESSFPFTATLSTQVNSSLLETETNVFDGLGRVLQKQLTSDPQGTVYSDTTFDPLGRVATVSNPYRQGSDVTSSPGITSYGYDALNRKTDTTYPDGSILKTAYCGASTLVTDPTKRWRRSRVDALGRLVEVDEPNGNTAVVNPSGCPGTGEPIWITSYTFDTVGNLTNVVQNGSHQRSFTYDSLSRLLCSSNPESATSACPAFGATSFPAGTLTYTYNPDGVVLQKKDSRGLSVNYMYDAIHREVSRNYSNGDPTVTTTYDQSGCLGLSGCQNIGHRTSMTDGAGSESWAFQVDPTNHRSVHVDQRTTTSGSNNLTKTTTYYLDLAGNVTQLVYPTGRTVNYTYDSADRPSTAVDSANGITYATGPKTSPGGTCTTNGTCYTPQGSIYAISIGQTSSFNGLDIVDSYNSRLQPIRIKASSPNGNAMDISYNFIDPVNGGNAGHVFSITNNLNSSRTQSFNYDQVNRIISAGTSATTGTYCWGYQYSYDSWGNLLSQAGWAPNYNACTEVVLSGVTADGNNHISVLGYDASGNVTSDGTNSYAWDTESQLKSAGAVNYTYDGDGRRVSKVGSKLYWYGKGSEILAETDAAGSSPNEYVYFGGKRVAMLPAGSNAQFYVEDSVGSSRIVTSSTGVVCYDADFYPFGGERAAADSCMQNNYKFEGKERDTETQNDYFGARYYSSRFGRWLSADWSTFPVAVPYSNLSNPQTLNLYALTTDDPESFADLDGHQGESGGAGAVDRRINPACPSSPCEVDVAAAARARAQNKPNPPQIDSNGNPTFNPPPPKPPGQAYEKTPDANYKTDVPRATGNLQNTINCTQECSGQRLTVTSTNERIPQHPADTPHGRGQAADLRVAPGTEGTVLRCAAQCGAQFGLNERAHPSAHATAPHVHIQLVPGRNGGRGDLPPDE